MKGSFFLVKKWKIEKELVTIENIEKQAIELGDYKGHGIHEFISYGGHGDRRGQTASDKGGKDCWWGQTILIT